MYINAICNGCIRRFSGNCNGCRHDPNPRDLYEKREIDKVYEQKQTDNFEQK